MTVKEPSNGIYENPIYSTPLVTCKYDSYRFKIEQDATLHFEELGTCDHSGGQQKNKSTEMNGVEICLLKPGLKCTSEVERFSGMTFESTGQGLLVNGSLMPWLHLDWATRFLPRIEQIAERKAASANAEMHNNVMAVCPVAFDALLMEFKEKGQMPTNDGTKGMTETCMPKYQSICNDPRSQANILARTSASTKHKNISHLDIENLCAALGAR